MDGKLSVPYVVRFNEILGHDIRIEAAERSIAEGRNVSVSEVIRWHVERSRRTQPPRTRSAQSVAA